MFTDPHRNMILARFNLAASLQSSAHHYDLKISTLEADKNLNQMLAKLLMKEAERISELAIAELTFSLKKDANT